jgi:endonuclease I
MKTETQKSFAFKRQMSEGKRLSEALQPIRTQQEVADMLGLSNEGVRRVEYRALAKVSKILRRWYAAGASMLLFACSVFAGPPPGYYDSANGLTGEPLRAALNAIIRNHTVVSYANTEEALKVLDQDRFDPDAVRLLYAQRSEPKSTFGTVEGWNREHLWPNSYGIDDSGPGYSDLFNLRAEDATINSARGNKYFDQSDTKDPNYQMPAHAEAAPTTSTDTKSWRPPDNVLGDIARAMFYMDVRYEGQKGEPDLVLTSYVTKITSEDAFMGRLAMLLKWHIEDPVDNTERARNDRIFLDYQHNRNPFVDHPEWVREVFWPKLNFFYDGAGMNFSWDLRHFGARLEVNINLNHTNPAPPGSNVGWFLLPGTPAEFKGEWFQFDFPDQCEDLKACIQFYRLNLLPNVNP